MESASLAASDPIRASRVAAQIGRMTLRAGGYPGRGLVGTMIRKTSRQRGGRSFHVVSHDGTRLSAWYSPAPEDVPKRLPIVFSHGLCEVKELHLQRSHRLNALGHDVILFDHRGHGRSQGRYVTFGVREREDLRSVADVAVERGWIGDRFITMGFSLGGATVLQHAGVDPRVAGVVAFAPFVDFREAILSFRAALAPWMGAAWLLRGFEKATRDHGFELDQATTLGAMERIEAPVLLIEGGRDRNLPPLNHTQKLAPAKTRGELKVIHLEHACHRTVCHHQWPGVEEQVAEFCAALR